MRATTLFLICIVLFSIGAPGQDDLRKQTVKLSALPAPQRSAINSAIQQWNRQFPQKPKDNSATLGEDASVATIRLGPSDEPDLVVTDDSGCSPTGNCSIFVLRPTKDEYRVALEATGQIITATPARANGFRNIKVRMHGSATMSEIKIYRFNGIRYVRSGCYNESFEEIDKDGNVQELDTPRMTPCQ